MSRIDALIIRHEGRRYRPYFDCCGQPYRECTCAQRGALCVGIGRNLDATPFSDDEISLMFSNDKARVVKECLETFYWFGRLNEARVAALLSLIFDLGLSGFQLFRGTIDGIELCDWNHAADELLDREWSRKVGDRAAEIAEMIRNGKYRKAPTSVLSKRRG